MQMLLCIRQINVHINVNPNWDRFQHLYIQQCIKTAIKQALNYLINKLKLASVQIH